MGTPVFDGSQPSRPVGHYTYTVADGSWSWSDEVYALHGYAPREVPATTAMLLSHKHPDDRARTYEVMEKALSDGEPFSCYHRIVDRHQRTRSVLSVGRGLRDAQGNVERVDGYFVDLTEPRRSETQAEVEAALARIAEHREVIDQAKGMVMLAAGCAPDEAFDRLRRASQHTNVKLHEIARRMVTAVGSQLRSSDDVMALLGTIPDKVR